MLVPVLSIQYYFIIIFLPAAPFLNAALCWSICVWILNKSPKRHLPRVLLTKKQKQKQKKLYKQYNAHRQDDLVYLYSIYVLYIYHISQTCPMQSPVLGHKILSCHFFCFCFCFFVNNMPLGYQGSTKDPCFTKKKDYMHRVRHVTYTIKIITHRETG
jgi:hypothetical protein